MAAKSLALQVGVAPACRALGVPRATFYRRQRTGPGRQQPRPTPARALCEVERERVLDTLASQRFVDRSPAEVVATLLDEGQYLCSERTMYRISWRFSGLLSFLAPCSCGPGALAISSCSSANALTEDESFGEHDPRAVWTAPGWPHETNKTNTGDES